jgi:SAM-dependent methyltransferase
VEAGGGKLLLGPGEVGSSLNSSSNSSKNFRITVFRSDGEICGVCPEPFGRGEVVDVDAEAGASLAQVPGVSFLRADLEGGPWPYAGRRFDAIVVTHYLHRPLFPLLAESLAPGGVLIYETFMVGHERFGRPTNPAFLLRSRELLEAFGARLAVLAFEEGVVSLPRPARVSRLCAVRAAGDAHLRLDAHR